jgi:hypothetical protein
VASQVMLDTVLRLHPKDAKKLQLPIRNTSITIIDVFADKGRPGFRKCTLGGPFGIPTAL